MVVLAWLWVVVMVVAEGACVIMLLMLFALFLGIKGPWYGQNQEREFDGENHAETSTGK